MTVENSFSIKSQQLLLEIARKAIESHLQNRSFSPFTLSDTVLFEKMGAFVSLHKVEKLRGCVGYITSEMPLHQTVAEAAVAAATQDPRFAPVNIEELAEIEIEISALTPLKCVKTANEIEIGVHGLYIVYGKQNGLLLPQVATARGLNRIQFLELTCKKAGLPSDASHDPDVELYLFGTHVFRDI